jgi:membrane dipeptidase
MLIVDAHEDIAWNMLTFKRDYCRGVEETRLIEKGSLAHQVNGDTLLGWDEYQIGHVAFIFSTLFASPARYCLGNWDSQCYANQIQAKQRYHQQLDTYLNLCDDNPEKFRLIKDKTTLDEILHAWDSPNDGPPIGLVVLMEGADAIESSDELEGWWNSGVRIIGPAWSGTLFCGGTNEPGPLTKEGYQLLEGMESCGFVLDISHMDEKAVLQALDYYSGSIIASHANVKKLIKDSDTNRQLSDRIIQGLIEHNGVIGIVPYNKFILHDWNEGDSRYLVSIEDVVRHMDYICQVAGNANHVGIGSDFDGGFGLQSTPHELNSIADLQKITSLLTIKGYKEVDIELIMGKNWIKCLNSVMPEKS